MGVLILLLVFVFMAIIIAVSGLFALLPFFLIPPIMYAWKNNQKKWAWQNIIVLSIYLMIWIILKAIFNADGNLYASIVSFFVFTAITAYSVIRWRRLKKQAKKADTI